MAYLAPAEFVTKMIDAGEAKIFMSNRDTLIRAYMAGAILALAAAFAIISPGISTADLNAAAEEVIMKYGAYSPFKNYPGPYPFPASTCISINDELVHGIPDKKRKLKEGF